MGGASAACGQTSNNNLQNGALQNSTRKASKLGGKLYSMIIVRYVVVCETGNDENDRLWWLDVRLQCSFWFDIYVK